MWNLSSLRVRADETAAPARIGTSGHLFALADTARSSKRWRRSGEIPDRLLTTGSDRGQLANTANRQTTAFAHKRTSASAAPDDRFRPPGDRRLASAWATKRSSRSDPAAPHGASGFATQQSSVGPAWVARVAPRAVRPAPTCWRLRSRDARSHAESALTAVSGLWAVASDAIRRSGRDLVPRLLAPSSRPASKHSGVLDRRLCFARLRDGCGVAAVAGRADMSLSTLARSSETGTSATTSSVRTADPGVSSERVSGPRCPQTCSSPDSGSPKRRQHWA